MCILGSLFRKRGKKSELQRQPPQAKYWSPDYKVALFHSTKFPDRLKSQENTFRSH